MPRLRSLLTGTFLLLALGPAVPLPHAGAQEEAGPPADEVPALGLRVNRAIARGVENLVAQQDSDGRWLGDENRYPGGLTAFVCYTLVRSGVSPRARSVSRGLKALSETNVKSTYGASARLLLYESIGGAGAWHEPAEVCADLLIETQREGLWAYPEGNLDLSNVQFAILGLRSARNMGLPVPSKTMHGCGQSIWRHLENESGGFLYTLDRVPTGGVTAAGLATVAVLDELAVDDSALAGILRKHRKDRARAHEWLVEHWNPGRNAYGDGAWTPGFHYAYLWAVERYGDLTGQKLLGEHDWYTEGAEWLIGDQNNDGGWGDRAEHTCFALLFLRRSILSGGKGLEDIYREIDELAAANPKPEPPRIHADAPFLVDWAVAGPYPGKPEQTGLFDPPFAPERVRPKTKGRLGRKKWQRVTLHDGSWTNLEETTGRAADYCLWVLGTRITWAGDGDREACLWFDFEDGWRVFLDGEELSSGARVGAPIKGDVRVVFDLAPGEHELVVLSEDVLGSAVFGARLSAPDGSPLPGELELGFGK